MQISRACACCFAVLIATHTSSALCEEQERSTVPATYPDAVGMAEQPDSLKKASQEGIGLLEAKKAKRKFQN